MSAFAEAVATVDRAGDIVATRISDARSVATSLQAQASAIANQLFVSGYPGDLGPPPTLPTINPDISVALNLPEISPISFGEIETELADPPDLEDISSLSPINIPEFQRSVQQITLPPAPTMGDIGMAPARPTLPAVTLPTAPNIAMPSPPALDQLTIPTFQGLSIPVFSAAAPQFEGTALSAVLQWSAPTYRPTILSETMEQIRRLWSGGSGIPPAVEQAMFERAASREDMIAEREIDSVAEEFSLRGFTMPNGMQAARVDNMRQDLAVKKLSLHRELTIKIAEWQVENVRFAVEQSIAAENVLVNIFLNLAQQTFEAAKTELQARIEIHNAQITVFNAKVEAYKAAAQVYDTQIRAELTKVEVYKAQIEAEVAKGQLNEQRVRAYVALVEGLRTQIEVYRTQMLGAQTQAEIVRSMIEGYRADVQAYAERIQADRYKFDAYEAQVRGEVAKLGVVDAEARAYAALIQGKTATLDADIKRIEFAIQKNQQLLAAYTAELEQEKVRIQAQTAVIDAGARAYVADTQRFSAVAEAESTKAQLEVTAREASLRSNIAYYEAQVRAYTAFMEQLIRKAQVRVDALSAAGQVSATLAAGAYAGVSVGASLSGGGQVGANSSLSTQVSESRSENTSTQKSYSTSRGIAFQGGRRDDLSWDP